MDGCIPMSKCEFLPVGPSLVRSPVRATANPAKELSPAFQWIECIGVAEKKEQKRIWKVDSGSQNSKFRPAHLYNVIQKQKFNHNRRESRIMFQ